VTEQRTKATLPTFFGNVVDVMYPEAEKIVVVMDKFKHTHAWITLEVFPAERGN